MVLYSKRSAVPASFDNVFRALANPTRRELLDRLRARNGQTLNELCEHSTGKRASVSKHLSILEGANLVATIGRGRVKLHYLNPIPIHEIYDRWIAKYEQNRLRALHELKKRLEEHQDAANNIQKGGPLEK